MSFFPELLRASLKSKFLFHMFVQAFDQNTPNIPENKQVCKKNGKKKIYCKI